MSSKIPVRIYIYMTNSQKWAKEVGHHGKISNRQSSISKGVRSKDKSYSFQYEMYFFSVVKYTYEIHY